MRKIETEHGPVYIAEAGEGDEAYEQLKTQGTETKQLGEKLWLDPDKFRASGPLVAFIAVLMLSVGFGVGSYFHDSSTTRVTLIISLTILLCVIGQARRMWIQYESVYLDVLNEHREAEHALLNKKFEVEAQVNKQLSAAATLQSTNNRVNTPAYYFTSEDFDNSAQMLLMPSVQAARKARAKITGQGLVETFLKGIR